MLCQSSAATHPGDVACHLPLMTFFATRSHSAKKLTMASASFRLVRKVYSANASALGAAAASSQALVLPRMRGLATATFFLATTLIGLGLGPFMAGYVSATNGDDLSLGVLSTFVAAPFGFILLVTALKLVPQAAATVVERARDAGEEV